MSRHATPGWRLAVGARRLKTGTPAVYLPTSLNWLSSDARTALVDDGTEELEATDDAEVDAFRLLSTFAQWFGISQESVLLATDATSKPRRSSLFESGDHRARSASRS